MDGSDKFFIVDCGDKRFGHIFGRLKSEGFRADAYDPLADYSGVDNAVFLFAPSTVLPLRLPDNCDVCSYKPAESLNAVFPSAKVRFLNYLDDESLAVKNARYTAEGALALLIENTGKSISQLNVGVFGGGRVGKAVLQILKQNGIYSVLTSIDEKELDFAEELGAAAVHLDDIGQYLPDFDVIINSIPSLILNGGKLDKLSKSAVIIDLASSPGGTDFVCAEKLGIRAMLALGLPGRYCAISAADDLYESIKERLRAK